MGKLLKVKEGATTLRISVDEEGEITKESRIINPNETETGYDPTDSSLQGVAFKSVEKIARLANTEVPNSYNMKGYKTLDVRLKQKDIGNMNGETRVLDIVSRNSHENTNLMYIKLESYVINSILVNIVDSVTCISM